MNSERRRALVVPREHGAWGILLVPLVTGAVVGLRAGGEASGLAPFTIAVLALFWLRTPLESWTGASPIRARSESEVRLVRNWSIGLALVAIAALAWLFWRRHNLAFVWVGTLAGTAAFAGNMARRFGRSLSQMIGAAGLTLTAAASYSVVTGRLGSAAWALWGANLAFAINQIQYVQLRIHSSKANRRVEKFWMGRPFFWSQVALAAVLIATSVAGLFPWMAALAFVPILARGFAWFLSPWKPLEVHALGKSELAYACCFGILLTILFR